MNRYTVILLVVAAILAWLAYRKIYTSDKGIGDSVHAVTSFFGIKQLEHCGCKARQNRWNKAIPY